jgi:energy-coupling factor transporter ATP-binding protein EcfA2
MSESKIGKMVQFSISDYKCIDVIDLDLQESGQFVPISGPNGSGKSSVMDAISVLFGGGSLPPGIIRRGKKEAIIQGVSSAGYKVKRRIYEQKKGKNEGKQISELVVTKDNQEIDSPQRLLNEVFSGFVTPTKLSNLSGAPLYNELIEMVGGDATLKADLSVKEAKEALSTERAILKRIGELEPPPDVDDIEIPDFDESAYLELSEKVQRAHALEAESERLLSDIKTREKEINEYEQKIAVMKLEIEQAEMTVGKYRTVIDKIPLKEKELEEMRAAKDTRNKNKEAIAAKEAYDKRKKEFEKQNAIMQAAKEAESEALKLQKEVYASLPLPAGMSISEEKNVFIDGVLWENECYSRRVETATIVMLESLKPDKLPIVFIEHGESLSQEKREEIAKTAIRMGATVFMEIFDEKPISGEGITLRESSNVPTIEAKEGTPTGKEKEMEQFPGPPPGTENKTQVVAETGPAGFDDVDDSFDIF